MKTFNEILMQLKQLDEITLLEILGVNSEDLVDRFQDLIEANPDKFTRELAQFYDDTDPEEEDD